MTCSQLTNIETWQTSRDELHCNEPPETLEATGRHCWNINRNNLVINFFLFFSQQPHKWGLEQKFCSQWLCRDSPKLCVTAAKAQPQSHCAYVALFFPSFRLKQIPMKLKEVHEEMKKAVCPQHSSDLLMVFIAPVAPVKDPAPSWVTSHHWIPALISDCLSSQYFSVTIYCHQLSPPSFHLCCGHREEENSSFPQSTFNKKQGQWTEVLQQTQNQIIIK